MALVWGVRLSLRVAFLGGGTGFGWVLGLRGGGPWLGFSGVPWFPACSPPISTSSSSTMSAQRADPWPLDSPIVTTMATTCGFKLGRCGAGWLKEAAKHKHNRQTEQAADRHARDARDAEARAAGAQHQGDGSGEPGGKGRHREERPRGQGTSKQDHPSIPTPSHPPPGLPTWR